MKQSQMVMSLAFMITALAHLGCTPPETVSRDTKHVETITDSFDGSTYYRTKYWNMIPAKGEFSSPFYVMAFSNSPKAQPHIVIHYLASDWFFLSNIDIKTDKSELISLAGVDPRREVKTGYVEEYVDFFPTRDQIEMMSASNTLEFRFTGDKTGSTQTNFIHANFIIALGQFQAMKGIK